MRILIVRLGAIGDVVHTLPALAVLRRAAPEAHLAWVVERGGSSQLLKDNPCLNELIEIDLRGWRKSLTRAETVKAIQATVARLRGAQFDLALDFQGLLKSALIPWFARVPRRIGFAREALREPASALLTTERVRAEDDDHVIKKNLQMVAHLGCDVTGAYQFPVSLAPEDLRFAEEHACGPGGSGESFAILNPGGGWPTKLWGAEGFAAIADRLWEIYRIRTTVTYGPGEEELAQSVVAHSRSGGVTTLDATLKQFFALARRARVFIGGDTGPMHLAAAAGTPVVSIFGPTSARRNGPFATDDVVIERFDLDCRVDCYRRSCSHTSCMKIPVEAVWRGITDRLQSLDHGSGVGLRELTVLSVK
jgi:lipopolysaccharide heptosyltransferase I